MKRAVILFTGLFVLALSGSGVFSGASESSAWHQKTARKTEGRQAPVIRHVIVISVDGLMPES